MGTNVSRQMLTELDQLSRIEITDELLSGFDFNDLIPKIQEVISQLDANKEVLQQATNKNGFMRFWNSVTGSNDGAILNSEKVLMESSKLTIGLALLSTLFAKLLKEQQDGLKNHQVQLARQHQEILEQQLHIQHLDHQIVDLIESRTGQASQSKSLPSATAIGFFSKATTITLLIVTGVMSATVAVLISHWIH